MTPAFGFSVGDFIAAIELCAKVAKALKNSGAAAADYQQTVLELQGLQNILTRLAALEPTESNIQHVNAIRGAALASSLSLQEFLTRLEKFEHSMSPFAVKKTVTLSRARRQTQYALFMADEVKKIRAVIYGNVLRINVLLATHASETLSRTEDHLGTHHEELMGRFQNLSDETADVVTGIANLKAEATTYHDAARQASSRSDNQMRELSNKVEVNTATLTQGLANLSAGFGSVTTSVAVIRDLSYQVLSLLRTIPAELGSLIQSVLHSNARIESILLSMNQKIAARPSLSLETNIHLEDALGRIHADIPFEWFRYWETFEGLLKARFKDTPGRQKLENGEFSLVHAKRTSISLDKDSWSGTITPGAHIVMLMLITNITFRNFACPRRSCTGRVVSEAGTADLLVCPKCDLRFIQQMTHVVSGNADEVATVQSIEDAQLFGARLGDDEAEDSALSRRILDVAEDIEVMGVADEGRPNSWESRDPRVDGRHPVLSDQSADIENATDASLTSSGVAEPPIMSWLSQTVPPKNPESVREWRDATETKQIELREREAKDLEVFRNVQIVMPAEVAAPGLDEPLAVHSEDHDLDVGARIFYRNILDRYPQIERPLARRLAIGNWHRQKHLTVQQAEVERAKIRAESRKFTEASRPKTAMGHSKRQVEDMGTNADGWEDVDDEHEQRAWSAMDCHRQTEHGTKKEHRTFGHCYDSSPSFSSLVRPIRATAPSFPSPLHQQPDMYAASWTPTPDIRQELTYGNYNPIGPFPNIYRTKERRFCSLPPLPLPLPVTSTTATSMKCYLCHYEISIRNKQSWRNHVMDDLQPYMCPFIDCSDVNATFSRRISLLQHIKQHEMVTASQIHYKTQIHAKCPFCDVTYLPGPMEHGGRAYIKHIGHHMEEIAFGVVSTAYENWSYDESGSELEPPNLYTPECTGQEDYIPPLNYSGNDYFLPADSRTHALLATGDQAYVDPVGWKDMQYTHDDTQYEMNFWTGNMTAISPASSANSGLRDPYPVDYLSAGSAGSESPELSLGHSTPSETSTKRRKSAVRKHPQNNTGRGTAEKRIGRRKGPLRPEQRRQASEIRKLRACLRCKFLKKTCDKGEPCDGCKARSARMSQVPCTRRAIRDLGYFLKYWRADRGSPEEKFSISNVKGLSDREQTVFITHGYGFWIPTTAREVFLRDESVFGAHASTAMASEFDTNSTQHTCDGRAKLMADYGAFNRELMMEYLDRHIDHQFEDFVDANYMGQRFVVDCLKTTYRYVLRSQSDLLRQALRLMVAYNLTLQPTTMEQCLDDEVVDLYIREGKPISSFPAPVLIGRCVKQELTDNWRDTHKELLDGLDRLYTSVYSGDKLKDWDQIFFVTVIVLAVWEQTQYDYHSRVAEGPVVERFCSEMEGDPVRVLTGLFCAISQKLPRFEEWDTLKHGSKYFVENVALHDALTEMRVHVIKYESYLRSRLRDAKFDRSDPGSLSCKFLARIFLRESRPHEQPHDRPQEISPTAVTA